MARIAIIIGYCRDYSGYPFDVREVRRTGLGFDVLIGWPEGARGKGMGGPQIILTRALRNYILNTFLARGKAARALPISYTALKRLRRIIGLDYYSEVSAWWIEKSPELASSTLTDFAAKYDLNLGTVSEWNKRLFGKRLRPNNWWRSEETQAILLAHEPDWLIAGRLDISEGSVRRLRWLSTNCESPLSVVSQKVKAGWQGRPSAKETANTVPRTKLFRTK